ncbi:MAG: hypothetical protein ACOX20_10580 [Limnochordia bacterium]|jgi:hypothetical protein|nr:hypothetical protein [Bacillota bacterium]
MIWRGRQLKGTVILLVLCIAVVAATPLVTGNPINIQSLIKLFGIGYAVRTFGPQLNDLINTLTLNHNLENRDATKVVPIITIGTGGYIGAAQVSGPKEKVDEVEAVAQLEGNFMNGLFRAKVLVPVDNINPTQGIKRVFGVGVSAIIDIRL